MLVWDTGLRGTLDERVEEVWAKICEAYEALGTPAGERLGHALFVSIFDKSRSDKPTKPPELHSKGAVGRHCVHALHYVLQHMGEWAPTGAGLSNDEDGSIYGMLRDLFDKFARFYDCIAYHGQWLPTDAALEAHDCLLAVGCYHQALCNVQMTRKRRLFHVTEKAHFCQHIALDLLERVKCVKAFEILK